MKNLSLSFLTFLLLSTFSLKAQKTVISSGTSNFSAGIIPTSSVAIDNADIKMVQKEWASYLKDLGGKLKEKKGEYFLDNAKIENISSDTLDIYSRVEKNGESVKILLAINRNGEFLSSTSTGASEMNDLLYKFAVDIKKEMNKDAIKVAEKALSNTEKDKKELLNKNDKLKSKIKDMKSSIADYERDIEDNNKKIDSQAQNVESKKAILDELKKSANDIE